MLKAINIECVKGYDALFSGYHLTIKPGQIVQITGENGSGKTSLLRILTGLSYPEEGDVLWNGESIFTEPQNYRLQLAYLGHLNGLKPGLSSIENLSLQQTLFAQPSNITALQALDAVGLSGYEPILVNQLSAGQQRRVALARLLLSNAKLWILDEPITAIDTTGVTVFEKIITQHILNDGMVILTSHQPLNFPELSVRQSAIPAVHH
ncbi:MAG: heme exporter protein A [Saprospiraceae bacterium]|jgi:heme exporter protein A